MHIFLSVSLCLCVIGCYQLGETKPFVRNEKTVSFAYLEKALRRVLEEITCRELTTEELEYKYHFDSNVTSNGRMNLKSIVIPDQEDAWKLHYLDLRRDGGDPNCVKKALPRLRMIEGRIPTSKVPVFPAYYMDWECSEDCVENIRNEDNYELLQRTDSCSDGVRDWDTIQAPTDYPLSVTRKCICRSGHV